MSTHPQEGLPNVEPQTSQPATDELARLSLVETLSFELQLERQGEGGYSDIYARNILDRDYDPLVVLAVAESTDPYVRAELASRMALVRAHDPALALHLMNQLTDDPEDLVKQAAASQLYYQLGADIWSGDQLH